MANLAEHPDLVSSGLPAELNNLERLGAYFTSQIHDLNNQVAVLSNSELLLEISDLPVSNELRVFLNGLFNSIHRISATCDRLNVARKFFPIEMETILLSDAASLVSDTVRRCKGWKTQNRAHENVSVLLYSSWVPTVVSQLIANAKSERGTVTLSVGELPPRHYLYSLRSRFGTSHTAAFLVHLVGEKHSQTKEIAAKTTVNNFQIALELIRLMGAGLSLGLSDDAEDILLAFPLESQN